MAKKSAAGPIITRRFQLSFPRASQVPARARERARASMAWRARARVLELVPVLMASQARERQVLRAQERLALVPVLALVQGAEWLASKHQSPPEQVQEARSARVAWSGRVAPSAWCR